MGSLTIPTGTKSVGDPSHTPDHNKLAVALAQLDDRAPLRPEDFGAVGNGVTDDQTALANALAALRPGQTLLLEAGKEYVHSNFLTVSIDGVTVTGGGVLTATNAQYAALEVAADDVLVENLTVQLRHAGTTLNGAINSAATSVVVHDVSAFPSGTGWKLIVDPGTSSREQMTVTARNDGTKTFTVTRGSSNTTAVSHSSGATVWPAVRQSGSESHLVYQYQGNRNTFRDLVIKNGDASGFLSEYSNDYTVENCSVIGGLADSFHNTHSCSGVRIFGCSTYYGGDDGVAVVSYDTAPSSVSNVWVDNCRVIGNGARGFSVVGGTNVSITNCYAESTAAAAYYVACEGSFNTYGVSKVVVDKCSSYNANTYAGIDHGSVILYNGRGGAYTISDVTFRNMTLRNTRSSASAELLVVGYNTPTADKIRYENVKIYDGPTSVWNSNFTPTNWFKDVSQTIGNTPSVGASGDWVLVGSNSGLTTASLTTTCSAIGATQYKIVIQAQSVSVADIPAIRFNGDTGANYTYRYMTVGATGTTLTDVQAGNATSAQLSGVSRVGERVIEVQIQRDTLNSTGTVVAAASNRSKSTVTGTWDMAGQINWYPGVYDELTSVTVFTVGGATFNKLRVWVYAIKP